MHQQTAVNGNFPARHCPGIGHRIVEHYKLVGQARPVAYRGEFTAHAGNISLQIRIDIVAAALCLLRRRIVGGTNGDFLLRRDQ